MKTENLRVWTTDLRTTDAVQANGMLARYIGRDPATQQVEAEYCCLGRGCETAGLAHTVADVAIDTGLDEHTILGLYYLDQARLTPPQFLVWLGLYDTIEEVAENAPESTIPDGHDVKIDWTDNSGEVIVDQEFGDVGGRIHLSASALNDDLHLTFEQIADVLDWFGITR